MTIIKRFISSTMALTILLSMFSVFGVTANAASGKSKKYDAFTSKTITITTLNSGSPSMTFKSTGTASYQGKEAKAPILSLKVYNHKTKKTTYYRITGNRCFGNSISSKLKLDKNTKYSVTVGYIFDKSINWGTYGIGDYKTTGWYQGNWQITATNKLNYSI